MKNIKILFTIIIFIQFSSCWAKSENPVSSSYLQALSTCPIPRFAPQPKNFLPRSVTRPQSSTRWDQTKTQAFSTYSPYSKDTTLFGVEIEFPVAIYPETVPRQKYFKAILNKCRNCPGLCTEVNDGISIDLYNPQKNPQKITISVRTDPAVVEVTTTPLTYKQTENWKDELNELIFNTVKELEPQGEFLNTETERNRWSGHINVSWPGLTSSAKKNHIETMNLILNLFIDLQNAPELAMGVLGGDIRNATPLAFGDSQDQNALRETIKDYKNGRIRMLSELVDSLQESIPDSFNGRFRPSRFSLINLESFFEPDSRWGREKGTRLELRGFFTPRSVDEILSNYRIVNARLDWLHRRLSKTEPEALDFTPPKIDPSYLKNATRHNFKTVGLIGNLTAESGAKVYVKFLREAGLSPQNELRYLRDPAVKAAVQKIAEGCLP